VLLEHVLAAQLPLGASGHLQDLEAFWNDGRQASPRLHDRSIEKLQDHFGASSNPRTGVITFTLEGPSPTVAKLMADTALAALNELVVSIRHKHAAAERQFTEERWKALRDSLTAREEILRRFYERNRQISSPELQFEDLRLRREVERVQTVYAQIGTQLEQARIQEVRDIPVISVIDSPTVPTNKSSPKTRLLLITAAILGTIGAIILGLIQLALEQLRQQQRPDQPSVATQARG
jgi:capsule polysaccharide export protein KpsE/RkpR